jgi:hypothetical protein
VDKPELIAALENAKNNFVLGQAAVCLFTLDPARKCLIGQEARFGEFTVSFEQVHNLLAIPADAEIANKEYLKMHFRALIKEGFELLKNYCAETDQQQLFRDEPWFHFARLIRNALSHNFRFSFNRRDDLPVSWEGRTIDRVMDGQDLQIAFLGWDGMYKLFAEFQIFAANKLA